MLSRHYAYHSCAPSRQALLSGRLPIHQNQENAACSSVPRHVPTLADALRGAGYATAFLGKWHCGFWQQRFLPTSRGFDTFTGYLGGSEDHYSQRAGDSCGGTSSASPGTKPSPNCVLEQNSLSCFAGHSVAAGMSKPCACSSRSGASPNTVPDRALLSL